MTALTQDRNTKRRSGSRFDFPMKAGTKLFAGALAVLEGGLATPGRTATGLVAVGVSIQQSDNSTGIDGAKSAPVEPGLWNFTNDGSITATDIQAAAWIVDDQTVAAADGGGARSQAGTIMDVDASGVWVRVGI